MQQGEKLARCDTILAGLQLGIAPHSARRCKQVAWKEALRRFLKLKNTLRSGIDGAMPSSALAAWNRVGLSGGRAIAITDAAHSFDERGICRVQLDAFAEL